MREGEETEERERDGEEEEEEGLAKRKRLIERDSIRGVPVSCRSASPLVRGLKEVPCKNCDTPLEICMSDCFFALNTIQNFESPPFKNQFFHVFFGEKCCYG